MNSGFMLLLYHDPLVIRASTIKEHITSFKQYSRFHIIAINTALGFPKMLRQIDFAGAILHYTLFAGYPYRIASDFLVFLKELNVKKIAFFQDEYFRVPDRLQFIRDYDVDIVFSLLDPQYFQQVYGSNTVYYALPGYVHSNLNSLWMKYAKPDEDKLVDVGYRARNLGADAGQGGMEKTLIAQNFIACANAEGAMLTLDISVNFADRYYGDDWYTFLGNCRAVLGVETGVSIFDLTDQVRPACEALLAQQPHLSSAEVYAALALNKYENAISYRTIGPRHFEAAAMKTVQILFEGHYSGVLQPIRHYLPLKKDFSNFRELLQLFNNLDQRRSIADRAYIDLIESGQYSYERFIQGFDDTVAQHCERLTPRHAVKADIKQKRLQNELTVLKIKRVLKKQVSAWFQN